MGFMARIAANIDKLACTVLISRWSAHEALEMVERERLTLLGGIPTQLALMLMDREFGRFDLSSLRSCAMGGGPASPNLVRRIREGFGVPVAVRYSCTELGLATGTSPDDPDEVVAETDGPPPPEGSPRILDRDDAVVGENAGRSAGVPGRHRSEPRTERGGH